MTHDVRASVSFVIVAEAMAIIEFSAIEKRNIRFLRDSTFQLFSNFSNLPSFQQVPQLDTIGFLKVGCES